MRWMILASLALVGFALATTRPATPLGLDTTVQDKENPEASSLSLTLTTDKQTYRAGEPIHFTLMLRNVSSEWFLVGKHVEFSDIPGAFVMSVTDGHGSPVHGDMVYFAGILGDFKHKDLFTWILENRLVLPPGCFLGMTATLQDRHYDVSSPGKYRLQVSYSDIGYKEIQEMGASTKKIKKAKEQAKFALWSGSIRSPEVWIEVVP